MLTLVFLNLHNNKISFIVKSIKYLIIMNINDLLNYFMAAIKPYINEQINVVL